jgi:hypothetical protein
MIRRIKKNKKGEIEILDAGSVEEYITFDEMEEKWESDPDLCDEDGIPYEMLDEEGNLTE